MFIEDKDWERAEEYLERVLDDEPENPYAYLGKAMTKAKVISPTNLTNKEIERIQKMRYYYRAKQYADEDLKELFRSWDERVS